MDVDDDEEEAKEADDDDTVDVPGVTRSSESLDE